MMVMRGRWTVVVLAMLVQSVGAAAQEVGSARVVPIQVTGDAAARFSLVILGDGYTAADMPRFREHVDKHLNILWSLEPFRSYRNYINVYAVEIVSGQSGITCDPEIREPRTTPLGLQFGGGCQNINARGITAPGNNETIRTYARMATSDFDQILVIANTDTYGGIGGAIATTSGGNALGPYITPHELGHSLGRLQDEYTYSARGRPGDSFVGTVEPPSIHHTLLTEEQMRRQQQKWFRWLGEESESGGKIGRFEGGQSRTTGIWRPSKHSMMISLGYYFDQVSRERMTQKISGNVELIAASTPAGPVSADDIIWIETAHPVYHELNVSWQLDGRPLASAVNTRNLSLAALKLAPGPHTISVKVVDPTEYVRDPAIRDTSFTATRSWTVTPGAVKATNAVPVAFTSSTQTSRPVGRNDVVYVETTHPHDRVLNVAWKLDGRTIPNPANSRSFRLADHQLSAGTHTLSATVTDPANSNAQSQTLNWTVDATGPTVKYTLGTPVTSLTTSGTPHYFMRDQFTMKLEPTDDQRGYVVAEFRVNGDGWHHYYGWPDAAPGTPFLFTPRGTVIKELVYGSLSSEGLSPQPWEPREPGWGTHRIEYRARDAAGNIGDTKDFRVTLRPAPACTETVTGQRAALQVNSGVTCLNNATINGAVSVAQGASLIVTNGRINGTLTASGANTVELVGARVDGVVTIGGTTGDVTIFGATLNRDLTLSSNTTGKPVTLVGNTIGGALNCTGNSAAPQNFATANTVRGTATGQCTW